MTTVVIREPNKPPEIIKVNVPGVPGSSGRSVELTKSATHIQWRLIGDTTWINLVALSDITGPGGGGSGGSQDLSAYAKTADVQTALNQKVNTTRVVNAGTGLTGGGDLSADRTLTVNFGTAAGTVAQGNDSRLSNTRVPTDGSVTTAKLADDSVTSAKIANGTITNADISSTAAIATSKISGLASVATTGSYNDLIDKPATSGGGTVSDATSTSKGVVQLAGDLGGTAASPTVPGLANKVNTNDSRLTDMRTPTDNTVSTNKIVDGAVTSSKIADGTITNTDISNTAAIAISKISGLSTVATTGSYNDLLNKPSTGGSSGLDQTAVANAIATEGSEIRNALLALFGNVNWKLDSDGIPYFTSIGAGGTTPPPSSGNIATVDGAIVGTSVVGGSGSSGSSGTLNTVDNAVVGTALVG